MNTRSLTQSHTEPSFTPIQTGVLQRKCASCGQHAIAGSQCKNCTSQRGQLPQQLTLDDPHTPLEQEADRVANQIMAASTDLALIPIKNEDAHNSGCSAEFDLK